MTINPITAGKAPMTPATTQILFVDLQPGIVSDGGTNSPDALVRSAVALARIGRLFELPMFASVVPTEVARPVSCPNLRPSCRA